MLSSSRRSLIRSSLSASHHLSPASSCSNFLAGSSKDLELTPLPASFQPFSTSSIPRAAPRTRYTKDQLKAISDKLEKKRAARQMKASQAAAKLAHAKVAKLEKEIEVEDKRKASEALTEGMEPITEEQLDSIYRGLLEAPLEDESALLALESSKDPLLADPSGKATGKPLLANREERLAALETRLDSLEEPEGMEVQGELEMGASEGLARRLRQRRSGNAIEVPRDEGREVEVDGVPQTPARNLLGRLEIMVEALPTTEGSGAIIQVPMGIAVTSEWRDLIMECAEQDDTEGVKKGLDLFRRCIPSSDSSIFTEVMELYGSKGRTRDAVDLAQYARNKSIPLSVTTHHHLLKSFLPGHPSLALQHLHSLEAAGHTPLLQTYTAVIESLLSPTSPPPLVQRGWDLYAHTRLVSHPIPDVALYSTMIQACARGPHPSPERAIDLFIEMTGDNRLPPSAEAYNGVIRACARQGSKENYFEALRFLRQMLDSNIEPSRQTFHAVLEGAKLHGDLPRARWILIKMIGVGGNSAPNGNSLALVFQTYATYQLPPKPTDRSKTALKNAIPLSPTSGSKQSPASPPETNDFASTDPKSIVDVLGEASLFYPGPLPQTIEGLLAEAQKLMEQCIGHEALHNLPPSDSSAPPTRFQSIVFPSVTPTTFLLNSYLRVLSSFAPFDASYDFFDTIYTRLGVEKNRFTYEGMLKRCETAKNREVGTRVGREVFEEWKRWSVVDAQREDESVLANEVEESVKETMNGDEVDRKIDEKAVEVLPPTEKEYVPSNVIKSGRNISLMYASMVRILARNFAAQEAVKLLQSFIALYPPLNLIWATHSLRTASRALPRQPSPVRLSNPLYPETTASAPLDRPPHILFDDIKLLHLRLANVEDQQGLKAVNGICTAYRKALQAAKEFEEGRVVRNKEGQKVKGREVVPSK